MPSYSSKSALLICSMRVARAALFWALVSASPMSFAQGSGEVEIGQMLREATIMGLNGPARKLSEFQGRPLVINVWASWCGPCRQEMASLERLAWHEQAAKFKVIGVSTDDRVEDARALLRQTNATIDQFIDRGLLIEKMLGASRLPLTVLVDANGRVVAKIYGAKEWDDANALRLVGKAFGISELARAR